VQRALLSLLIFFLGSSTSVLSEGNFILQFQTADPELESCAYNGLETRLRYRLRLCGEFHDRAFRCGPERGESKFLIFDPVANNYQITRDRFNDGQDPDLRVFRKRHLALTYLLESAPFSTKFLSNGLGFRENVRIESKVTVFCGEQNFIARLAHNLSFGLIGGALYDLRWQVDRINRNDLYSPVAKSFRVLIGNK
jgi:hypothetical protein